MEPLTTNCATAPGLQRLARVGLAAAVAAVALGMPEPAVAMYRCVGQDAHVYLVREPFGQTIGVRCTAEAAAATQSAAPAPAAPAPPPATQVSLAASVFGFTPQGGSLLLSDSRLRAGVFGLALAPGATGADTSAEPSPAVAAIIDRAAQRYGHEPYLLRAIVRVESGFNPDAVSPKGAIGLMQVMPATAARLGVPSPNRTLFDPASNVDAGSQYLRQLVDMFPGRREWAIAAYNAGEGAVLRYGGIPPFPETEDYVRKVMADYRRQRGGW